MTRLEENVINEFGTTFANDLFEPYYGIDAFLGNIWLQCVVLKVFGLEKNESEAELIWGFRYENVMGKKKFFGCTCALFVSVLETKWPKGL